MREYFSFCKIYIYIHILLKEKTTLIFGANGWYLTIPDIQERIDSFVIKPTILHLESGHSPHIECPEELAKHLLNIISSVNANSL